MRRFLCLGVMLACALALGGCATSPAGVAADAGSLKALDAAEFTPIGHWWMTKAVGDEIGIRPDVVEQLAYYTDVPDSQFWQYAAVPVAVWGVAYIPYRQRIMDTLHSLHGGHQDAVQCRRYRLEKLIGGYALPASGSTAGVDPEKLWRMGFLIHAFGDSYAHVHGLEALGTLKAYNPIVGHAFSYPSADSVKDFPWKLTDYQEALCRVLSKAAGKEPPKCSKQAVKVSLDEDVKARYRSMITLGKVNAFLSETQQVLNAPVDDVCKDPANQKAL